MTEQGWQHWLPRVAAFHAQVLKAGTGGGRGYLSKLHAGVRYGLTADLSLLGVEPEEAVTRQSLTLELDEEPDFSGFENEPEIDEESAELDLFGAIENDEEGGNIEKDRDSDSRELSAKRDSAAAAARRIFLKQRGDPYNRETSIGYPLLGARVGRKKVSGPLFYWKVDPHLDTATNRLTLSRATLSPSLNSVLLSKFSEDKAEVDLVREQLLPVVQADPFDLSDVNKAVQQLRSIFSPLSDLVQIEASAAPLGDFLDGVSDLSGRDAALLGEVPVLVNSSRSFAFILDDLSSIEKFEDAAESSAVSGFVGDLPEEVERIEERGLPFYDTMDGGDPLWFPMKSNEAQRRVGRKARRVRTLTVQGPPGTGKTQTIANVVCDLVSLGKSVLVTSHTHKALEVLADKLPRIDHLAVPVLASDRESLTKLRSELEAVQESGDRDPGELQEAVERAEAALRELDADLRHLNRRYTELRAIEAEEFSEHVRLADIREYHQIAPDDSPDHNEQERIASGLQEYAQKVLDLLPALSHFRSFFQADGTATSRAREARRYQLLVTLLTLYERTSQKRAERALVVAQEVARESGPAEAIEEELLRWTRWLRDQGVRIEAEIQWVRDRSDGLAEVLSSLLRCARSLNGVGELRKAWTKHAEYFRNCDLSGDEVPDPLSPVQRDEVEAAIRRLREARESFLSWYLAPSARRARTCLEDAGFSITGRKQAVAQLEHVQAVLEWQDHRRDCAALAEAYDSDLPAFVSESVSPNATTRALERQARDRIRLLALTQAVVDSPLRKSVEPPLERFGHEVLHELGAKPAETLAEDVEDAASRLHELRSAEFLSRELDVSKEWSEHKHQILSAIRSRDPNAVDDQRIEQLRALVQHYPVFKRLRDLADTVLSDLPNTLDQLEKELRATEAVPHWVQESSLALEAHRLASLLQQSLAANPDDLTEIAERLAEGQEQRREIILRIIERRRELGVRRAVRSPATNNALLNMRDLLGRRRLTNSFLSLRDQIDYRELLKLFPCWICNIDDVARLFPLEASLFDYLVIDEASQCPQTALLPLAFRARRVVVVGDRKQLQPATARFLAGDAVAVMKENAGINEHPVGAAFDGKKSLLDIAERYREEFDFLDEHFRCDPEIIRWSNERFYDNRLKILTHRRTQTFQKTLEVRELKDADEERETKTNRKEAETVVRELRRLIDSGEVDRMTLGVISPFRPQADLLNELIEKEFSGQPELKDRMRLLASTADGFQGDERDIILYSFRYGPSSHPASISAIEREGERLNVAFTRAKRKVVCFISHSLSRFPRGLIRSFLAHSKESERADTTRGRRPDRFESQFEEEVCFALRDRGLTVTTQEPVARYRIDLVVEDDQGRVLGVECDGQWKFNELGELRPHDYQRQDVIERAGWKIHRISGRSWLHNPEREIDRVVELLESLPSAKEREIATGPRVTAEEPQVAVAIDEPRPPGQEENLGDYEVSDEELVPPEETVLDEFGDSHGAQVTGVKRLWRWFLLKGHLEGAALDTLGDIEGKLETRKPLTDSELDFLAELLYTAYRRGYNPETAEDLPEDSRSRMEVGAERRVTDEAERADRAPADKLWEGASLSSTQSYILEYLYDSHPKGRTKYEIAGHLKSDCDVSREEAKPSQVNRYLYGPLDNWVEKKGDRPPRWFIRMEE